MDETTLELVTTDRARVRREDRLSMPVVAGTGICQQRPDAAHPSFDSKTEAAYASELDALLHAGELVRWWYHPFSLNLGGGVRYTPDFLCWLAWPLPESGSMTTGRWLQVREVKGWSKNLRDGMTRLKIAASLYPCFSFVVVRRVKGQWELQTL